MDILAHALWTTAAGAVGRNKTKRRIHLGWMAAWGVFPDLIVFTIPACVRIWRWLTGASKSLLPDGSGPHFNWVWGLYNASHSVLVFGVCFATIWLLIRRPMLEMSGWAIHIFIDIFTHTGLFAIRFLWPVSSIHFNGERWEAPWFLALNYAALASVGLWLWVRRVKGPVSGK